MKRRIEMRTKEELSVIQQEFLEIYHLLMEKKLFVEDKLSLGNLALFVDYYIHRYQWEEKKNKLKHWALFNDRNEINMFIARELVECAKRLDISDNLQFKLEKMESDYRKGILGYFDIILDPYEFPDWFKGVSTYYPLLSKKDFYQKLVKRLRTFMDLRNEEDLLALYYYANYYYQSKKLLDKLLELDGWIQEKNRNEVCWYFATSIFSIYYPELKRAKDEKETQYALSCLRKYESLYKSNQLTSFHLFSKMKLNELKYQFKEM